MAAVELSRSEAYSNSVRLLRNLARLAERRLSQTPEAVPLRDALNDLWADMTEEEQDLIEALSADLWTLMESEPLGPEPESRHLSGFRDAVAGRHWTQVSAFLRDFPRLATGSEGALLRAECWTAHGEVAIASEFAMHASRLLLVQSVRAPSFFVMSRRSELQRKSGAVRKGGSVPFLELVL